MAAQKFMSPGVFTTEIDLSFLAQGVAGIGAAVVGRTPQGPAMVPTFVNGFDAYTKVFGIPTPGFNAVYGAKNYLKNSAAMTQVRVLGHDDGTSTVNGYVIQDGISAIVDGASKAALAVIHYSGSAGALTVAGVPLDANNFIIRLTGSDGQVVFAATASFVPSSANYVEKVLNTDPTKYATYGHYLYQNFSYRDPAVSASWGVAPASGSARSFQRNFSQGTTAWVKSQPVGGQEYNLFRFHTLKHGRATNDDIKVMISNVKQSPAPTATPFGTFDVIVRDFSDTDQRGVTIESFVGVDLNPASKNFILRRIGNHLEEFDTTQRKFVGTGDFKSMSQEIRVELDSSTNYPAEALPWGHRGYTKPTFSASLGIPSVADLRLVENQRDRAGNLDPNICWGITYLSGGVEDRMRADPSSAVLGADADFSLAFLTSSYSNGRQVWTYLSGGQPANQIYQSVYASASMHKFTLPFQGGFDGWDLRVADPLYLANIADDTDIGVVSLKRALDTIANPDQFDMNLLAVPGVHNIRVTDRARSIVNDRGDAMFVMDVTGASVPEVIGLLKAREIDDNYTATYYPDVKLNDKVNNAVLTVPPSVAVLGAIAFNDRVGQPFFAPAGLNRGGLTQFDIIDVQDRLTFQDRDDLYINRINPIASFPNEGIVVWGQKTLQVAASALDRVNVRRLLIFAKKTIASAAKMLLFEPNNPQTWQRFINVVNPILEKIRQDQGLNRFKVVMDTSTNTNDLIDRNIMTGKIFLEPTKSAEYIDLSFIITNAGVSFGE